MNDRNDYCHTLAAQIQALFAAGFTADAATVHFINSTFDHPDHQQLKAVLHDSDHCDREGLMDLIVTPGFHIFLEMEALLGEVVLTGTDVGRIDTLLPEKTQTSVRVDGIDEPVFFTLPAAGRHRFLEQLNLTRQIDARIRSALETVLPRPQDRLTVLAKTRYSRMAPSPTWTSFIAEFILVFERMDHNKWFSALDFILDMSCRHTLETDIYNAFVREKRHCLKQVEASLKLTAQLAKNNLETLMIQGNRIGVAADIVKLYQQTATIDEICLLVLKKTPRTEANQSSGPESFAFLSKKHPFAH